MPHATDLDLTPKDIAELASPDAIAAFLTKLGYDTSKRTLLSPEAVGLTGESAAAIKRIELLSQDPEQFLRVVFAQPRSLTAKVRTDLARVLGRGTLDHLIILASDFDTLEFVLLDKLKREQAGPSNVERIKTVPKVIKVARRDVDRRDLKALRRLTWTCRDALEQYDKLRSVFEAAHYTGEYFQNRGLFSDYFLTDRLRSDPAWRANPSELFAFARDLLRNAKARWGEMDKSALRSELLEPLFNKLGFQPVLNRSSKNDQTQPDYLLKDSAGAKLTAAFIYAWDRWLDGPDLTDADTPEENPGACVVTALDEGIADWIIVTNGKLWRLYSRQAHARATNFYEVDLVEALTESGDTDPNEAFRYWALFFRPNAFRPSVMPGKSQAGVSETKKQSLPALPEPAKADGSDGVKCWLDAVLEGSREYAKNLGERLKDRIFYSIFPHLAEGFLADRKQRLGVSEEATDDELAEIFEATLTLLYRLLFLLYAESRDLLPIREAPYFAASLKKIKEEIAGKGGGAESGVRERLQKAYSGKEIGLYDRLCRLFRAMDKGDPVLNVPTYNGGLFNTDPSPPGPDGETDGRSADRRGVRIARFLLEHKAPDRYLALAIDHLARDSDERTLSLVFLDYKSLEVRHLGSIYEGLLEFKLKIADKDLTTKADKKGEIYIPLSGAKSKRGRQTAALVRRGDIYLSNDKSHRKASGSYYTPDPIVEYIVGNTVGPVLDQKLDPLRAEFRRARKTFDNEVAKSQAYPSKDVRGGKMNHRQWAMLQMYNAHKDLVEDFFELRVLDPAMGSGHFLVETVDFVTDRLLKFLNQFPINPVNYALERTRASILESLGEQGVTVDPEKLTDINLLKRHVLKRCIYGVDLNPMAVELAKVSLWLDAFTLGAPLNFLDHHLRCGNSLIGATFSELEETTKDRLFALDYQPLMRAINYVLLVSKMADATAAEVATSQSQYAKARESLAGYRVFLDLLVAEHFGCEHGSEILKHGKPNAKSRDEFEASLPEEWERAAVAEAEQLAERPDLRFFHWEIEFPEVFFGFVDADQRQIKHKELIEEGSAGFDCAVGNPPYVRQETIKALKAYLKTKYQTYDSTNDLYVYFQELEIKNLRADGRMGMIVANKWMRSGYGQKVRDFLQRTGQPLEVIDFGHSPVFPDADTFPCILVATKRCRPLAEQERPPETETMAVCEVPREHWHDRMDLESFVAARGRNIPTTLLRVQGWSLEDPRIQALLEKLRYQGVPLQEFCGSNIFRGSGTGLNEAFFIDTAVRDRLITEDEQSAKIIRPLLRGRDIDRWRPRSSGMFLIFATRGIPIDRYPAVKRHLSQFRQRLEPRPSDWDESRDRWPGRRPGDYRWYELQDSPAEEAAAALSRPKIVFQEMAWFNRFGLDGDGAAITNTAYVVPDTRLGVMAVLNSALAWWYMWRVAQHGKDEVLRLIGAFMDKFPMPSTLTDEPIQEIEMHTARLIEEADEYHSLEDEIADLATGRFSLCSPDLRVATWLPLPSDVFVTRMLTLGDVRRPAATLRDQLAVFQRTQRRRQLELLTRQLELEKKLAALVEDAYGLTADERALLRSTRPVRDPLDVLEAKIRGGPQVEEVSADE